MTKNRGKVLRFSVDAQLPYRPTDVQVYLADYEDTAPAGAVAVASLPGLRLSKDGLSLQSISEPVKTIVRHRTHRTYRAQALRLTKLELFFRVRACVCV